jgi:hypothetical protein
MFEGEEQINSGADIEASPEPQESSEKPTETAEAAAPKETKPESTNEDNTPFHKHPRWIERDQELKAEREARRQLEQRYQDMERRIQEVSQPKGPDKRSAMLERLKGIDPEFAEFVSGLAPQKELEDLRQWKQQYDAQQARQQVNTTIASLHSQNKVSEDLQPRYQLALEAKIRANPNARLEDLPSLYKEVHEDYSKWIDSIKRAERAAYTEAKKADAKIPASTSKGTQVSQNKPKSEWAKDKQEALSQVVQRTLAKRNASRDIG